MSLILKIQKAEGTFIKDMSRDCHFAIDCACGGKDGSHLKNPGTLDASLRSYIPENPQAKLEHTFYTQENLFTDILFFRHNEERSQLPLSIVCNTCNKEFSFTFSSYWKLSEEIRKYNLENKRK